MLGTLKEEFEDDFHEGEEEGNEEVIEEAIPYKRFGYSKALPIHQDEFDVLDLFKSKEAIKKYRFANEKGLIIEVMNFGATIMSIHMPDKFGNMADVLLGFDTVDEYYERNCKLGGMIGRTANIIEDGTFRLGDELYFLRKNAGAHHRDGGVMSFDKVIWKSNVDTASNSLVLSYLSEDHEEGYPGNLLTRIIMKLSDENEFIIQINAVCDESSPVDISPRIFLNLAGHGAGEETIKNHKVLINSDMYIMQNSQGVPTGKLRHVNQTYFDLRTPKPFHFALDRIRGGGYNHSFCLNTSSRDESGVIFASRLEECEYGRYVEVWTDAPALYFYTANNFPESQNLEERTIDEEQSVQTTSKTKHPSGQLKGKQNFYYCRHGAVALSPQGYTNSVNIKEFPPCVAKPHKAYQRKVIYKFGVSNKILPRPKTMKVEGRSEKSLDHTNSLE